MNNRCIWLLGLSGAGKTTLAEALKAQLAVEKSILLDGDVLRNGLNNNLGFSDADRTENVRRTAEVAQLFLNEGYWVIVALITPLEAMRVNNRRILGDKYIEVFIDTPLSICQDRDPKGLYAKVAQKQITHFTGIDAPFDRPMQADLVVETDTMSIEDSTRKLLAYVIS